MQGQIEHQASVWQKRSLSQLKNLPWLLQSCRLGPQARVSTELLSALEEPYLTEVVL